MIFSIYDSMIMLQGESATYILNEDTQPVKRAIGVSHIVCKDEFRQNLDLTSGVYFAFAIIGDA